MFIVFHVNRVPKKLIQKIIAEYEKFDISSPRKCFFKIDLIISNFSTSCHDSRGIAPIVKFV